MKKKIKNSIFKIFIVKIFLKNNIFSTHLKNLKITIFEQDEYGLKLVRSNEYIENI